MGNTPDELRIIIFKTKDTIKLVGKLSTGFFLRVTS